MSADSPESGPSTGSEPTAAGDVLTLRLDGAPTVFVGAALVGITSFTAAQTLAVVASGRFPESDAVGGLLTLVVFAAGVAFVVRGAAAEFARARTRPGADE